MKPILRRERLLRATVCEIERGLFYVTYPDRELESQRLGLPSYGLGDRASEVKREMEKDIRAVGYEIILWEEVLVIPPRLSLRDGSYVDRTNLLAEGPII